MHILAWPSYYCLFFSGDILVFFELTSLFVVDLALITIIVMSSLALYHEI